MPERNTTSKVRGEYLDHRQETFPQSVAGLSVPAISRVLHKYDGYKRLLDNHSQSEIGFDFDRMVGAIPVVQRLAQDRNLTAEGLSKDERRALRRAAKAGAKYLDIPIVRHLQGIDAGLILATVIPPVGYVGRRLLNRTIDRQVPEKIQENIEMIGRQIGRFEGVARVVGSFENPREAWKGDLVHVYQDILARGTFFADQGLSPAQATARALKEVLGEVLAPTEAQKYPFVQRLLGELRKMQPLPEVPENETVLAIASPIIMEIFESTLGVDHTHSQIIEADLRKHADWKLRWGRRAIGAPGAGVSYEIKQLRALRNTGPNLIRALTEVLPGNGSQFKKEFAAFLAPFKAR
ncbi:MAG TPA: hypothetical protein VFQ63_02575 [Patescibacteria group bacterium]|nr:hypothetical protein [Patescibacteria group bacterium]